MGWADEHTELRDTLQSCEKFVKYMTTILHHGGVTTGNRAYLKWSEVQMKNSLPF